MNSQRTQEILHFLEAHRADMVQFLKDLVEEESPSHAPESQHPVLLLLSEQLEKAGLSVHRIRGKASGGMLIGRGQKTQNQLHQLLVGHCDTVWPLGTLTTMPFLVEEDVVKGPGSFDMKAGLVQMIFALKTCHELKRKLPVEPVVLINSDEEIGSSESTETIIRLARGAVRAFVLEPAFDLSGKLKTARKAVGRFHVIIKGQAAHAGVNPEAGVSAILELSHQIQKLFSLNDPAKGITVNVGTVDGGLRPNVVAPQVEAVLDVRVPTQKDEVEVEKAIRGLEPVHPGATIEVTGGFGRPAMEPIERNQALWKLAWQLGKEELGIELEQAAVGGASDGNTTSLYTATLDGLGAVGDGAHAIHEHVLISKMIERAALLTLLLLAPVPERST